jgi:hypothetical protein
MLSQLSDFVQDVALMSVIFACVVGSFFLSCLSCLVLVGGFFLAWVVAVDGGIPDENSSHPKSMVAAHGVVCFGWICPI